MKSLKSIGLALFPARSTDSKATIAGYEAASICQSFLYSVYLYGKLILFIIYICRLTGFWGFGVLGLY